MYCDNPRLDTIWLISFGYYRWYVSLSNFYMLTHMNSSIYPSYVLSIPATLMSATIFPSYSLSSPSGTEVGGELIKREIKKMLEFIFAGTI